MLKTLLKVQGNFSGPPFNFYNFVRGGKADHNYNYKFSVLTKNLIKTSKASVGLTPEGHILIKINENQDIELKDIVEIHEAKSILAGNRKHTVIFVTPTFGNISHEARVFSGSKKVNHNAVAKAIVANSLSGRLIGTFFIKVIRPPAPTRLFKTIEEASAWLNKKLATLNANEKTVI